MTVVLLAPALAACTSTTRAAEPADSPIPPAARPATDPSPTPSPRFESPGPKDHPIALSDANGALLLATVRHPDRVGTATLWRKEPAGWHKIGMVDDAVPQHMVYDTDGTRLWPGPGRQDLLASFGEHGAEPRIGYSRDGGATWIRLVASVDTWLAAHSRNFDYLYGITHNERSLLRAAFGTTSVKTLPLPRNPHRRVGYILHELSDGTLLLEDSCSYLRTGDPRGSPSHYRISRDHGDTWSGRRALPGSVCLYETAGNTAYACDNYCEDRDGLYQSTDLLHWTHTRGLVEDDPPWAPRICSGWSPGDEQGPDELETAVRIGEDVFALFHLNYRNGHEILPREGIFDESHHQVTHVLMVSHDDCHTWKRALE